MGYSPGDFINRAHEVHWELKDHGVIVLWDKYETKAILWMAPEDAKRCFDQLRTCITVATGEDPA